MSTGSVNLERIHRYDGGLGIGAHSISDKGEIGYLGRDPLLARTYHLASLIPTSSSDSDRVALRTGFTLESVQRAGCAPDGSWGYLITDRDIYFVIQSDASARRSSLQVRQGESFLDIQVAGDNSHRSAVTLTQDRGSTSFTVTLLESADESGSLSVVWSKTWTEAVVATAISPDGTFIVTAHQSGNISLLDRHRRVMWLYAGADESPVIAAAVDNDGCVVALDSAGTLKRHAAGNGSVDWRLQLPVHHPDIRGNLPAAMLSADRHTNVVLCAVNRSEHLDDLRGSYVFLNGLNGQVIWEDRMDSAITGASLSPSGSYCAISTQAGEIIRMSLAGRKQRATDGDPEVASQLLERAKRAFNNHNFAKAVRVLLEVFELDPAMTGTGQLYDEATWHLRESVMKKSVKISPESLAKVEEALFVLPFDERLTIRRNALARLLAENLGREAGECIAEGRLEDAIAKLTEALTIDRSQSELRNALRAASDQLALTLIREADAAFHHEKFAEAIDMLERVQELRPGEAAIGHRLEHAKGLHAYATGMVNYIAKRYAEASFWFRKTLALLPDHAEATRYLTYAEQFGRRQAAEDVSSRMSELSAVAERFNGLAPDVSPPTPQSPIESSPHSPGKPDAIEQHPAARDHRELEPESRVAESASGDRAITPIRPSSHPPIGEARPTTPTMPTHGIVHRSRPTAPSISSSPTGPSSPLDGPKYWK